MRKNYIKVSTTKICHLFLRVEQETLNSPKNMTHFLVFVFQLQFMLKSQQKVLIKLSKICQSHQKLSKGQKVASHFTEIVYKYSSSEDSRKCQHPFKLFVDLLDHSLKPGTTSNWILMTQILAPANSAWVCWLCWLCWCGGITRLNISEFYYLDELYSNELVFILSFVSSNNTDVANTERFILMHTRYVFYFSGLASFSQKLCKLEESIHLYRILFSLLRFSCFWPTMNSFMPSKERIFASRLLAYSKS